jgi:hypothetical protein
MIDFYFLATQFGLPGVGAFIGSSLAYIVMCPNRGCCQMKKIKEMVENG